MDRKQRLTVSLSAQSMKAFAELRETTDADTDSEVVRNALRLHLALLRAQLSGKELLVRDGNTDHLIPVRLFAPE
jgi:metal-responsive CopG/Arc/MetJ family transcriptional regulator